MLSKEEMLNISEGKCPNVGNVLSYKHNVDMNSNTQFFDALIFATNNIKGVMT